MCLNHGPIQLIFICGVEHAYDTIQLIGLGLGLIDRCICLFDQSGVMLGHLVHLADSHVDLVDRRCLLAALSSNALQHSRVFADGLQNFRELFGRFRNKPGGRREVLGMEIGTSEAEAIWTEFLRKLTRRGLRGVKLVISDAHEGIKAAVTKVLCATWQRCRVHFMRNVLAHAGKSGRRVASAFIATAFAQETPEAASTQWRAVADQIRPRVPKLATIMDEAEHDVLAYMSFPREHRAKLHSNNPIERVNGEVKRRTEVVGIFPNEDAIVRLVGAILLEQNDEWAVQRTRYMTLESVAPLSDDPLVSLPAVPAR